MTALWAWVTDHATVLSAVASAISTVIVAAFTVGLFRATSRQSQLLGRSIDLARDEFNAAHRPHITLLTVEFDEKFTDDGNDSQIGARVFYVNDGMAPARITSIDARIGRTRTRFIVVPGLHPVADIPTEPLASGMKGFIRLQSLDSLNLERNHQRAVDARLEFHCVGIISYEDSAGRRRETGFGRAFNALTQSWVETEISKQYEYSY